MSQQLKTCLGIAFASVFSVWSGYSIHVLPIEEQALPFLEALLEGTGRALDQYRIAPYLLIGLIRDGISLIVRDEYRLFLPFLPLILWVFEDYRQKGVSI